MIAFLLALLIAFAADLPDDEPLTVALDDENPALLTFSGMAGDAVTITVNRADDDDALNDPVVAILRDGRVLAYNHRHGTDSAGLHERDARITDFVLPADGVYGVYVNTYGGIYAGELIVTLERGDIFRAEITADERGTTIRAVLPVSRPFEQTFEAGAGDVLTITARDQGRTLDPVLALLDGSGAVVAFNDDHRGHDLTLDAFDAQIWRFVVPADGTYTARVSDFLGRAGAFTLTITFDDPP